MELKITLYGRNSAEISAILAEIGRLGYQTGQDFEFYFDTGRYDWNTNQPIAPQTTFVFFNPGLATWFGLRYNSERK